MADRRQATRLPSGFYNPSTQQSSNATYPVPGSGGGLPQQQQVARYDYNNNINNNRNNNMAQYPFPAASARSQQQQASHSAPLNRNHGHGHYRHQNHSQRPNHSKRQRQQQQHQQHHHHQQHRQHQRKRPPSLPPTPPQPQPQSNAEFKCDACNLPLDSSAALEAHIKSHVTCHYAGCNFSAAPKVVKGHYQATHGKFSSSNGGSGFKTITLAIPGVPVQRFRICVGNRPQDVQEWINERRKRFPRTNNQSNATTVKEPPSEKTIVVAENKPEMAPPPSMAELSTLLQGYGSSSEEEEEDNDEKNMTATKSIENTPSKEDDAASRMDTTGTQAVESKPPAGRVKAEAEGHEAVSPPTAVVDPCMTAATATATEFKTKKPCHAFMRHGQCHRGDACPYRHDNLPSPQQQQEQQQAAAASNHNKPIPPPRKRPKLTLLEKLLTNDVARETTLTLQLLEYIAKSKFLQNNKARGDVKIAADIDDDTVAAETTTTKI